MVYKGFKGLDEFQEIACARKCIGIVMREWEVRQPHRPVGKLETQAVPAFAAPALGNAMTLQHEMSKAALFQPVAHREPGLAATDHQRLDAFSRHGARPCGGRPALPRRA